MFSVQKMNGKHLQWLNRIKFYGLHHRLVLVKQPVDIKKMF